MSDPSAGSLIAIVGPSSLYGKEILVALEDRNLRVQDIILLDDQPDAVGTLTQAGGEPVFIRPLAEDSFSGVHLAFFAAGSDSSRRNVSAALRAGTRVIDLFDVNPAESGTPLRIPFLDSLPTGGESQRVPQRIAAPSAPVIIAAALAIALAPFSPLSIDATFFIPVSEYGQPGVDELESQTRQLLSLQPVSSEVFGGQVAFNLFAPTFSSAGSAGPDSPLASVRTRISLDAALYLKGRAASPAIQLIQAPVFYGSSFSASAHFAGPADIPRLEAAIRNVGIEVTKSGQAPPGNVSVVGESVIRIGPPIPDPAVSSTLWVAGAADNLRLVATNAVQIAEEILAGLSF
jgi:aspartate-semialdehyde dehydrogenase